MVSRSGRLDRHVSFLGLIVGVLLLGTTPLTLRAQTDSRPTIGLLGTKAAFTVQKAEHIDRAKAVALRLDGRLQVFDGHDQSIPAHVRGVMVYGGFYEDEWGDAIREFVRGGGRAIVFATEDLAGVNAFGEDFGVMVTDLPDDDTGSTVELVGDDYLPGLVAADHTLQMGALEPVGLIPVVEGFTTRQLAGGDGEDRVIAARRTLGEGEVIVTVQPVREPMPGAEGEDSHPGLFFADPYIEERQNLDATRRVLGWLLDD